MKKHKVGRPGKKDFISKRVIDNAGRIMIPKEMRTTLSINPSDELTVSLEDNKIVITKDYSNCTCCGGIINLYNFKNITICSNCIMEVARGLLKDIEGVKNAEDK